MIKKDADEAISYYMDSFIFKKPRNCLHKYDYGDIETVGVSLKRIDNKCPAKESFGFYLGEHKDGFVVLTGNLIEYKDLFCEVFESVDEMKSQWILD